MITGRYGGTNGGHIIDVGLLHDLDGYFAALPPGARVPLAAEEGGVPNPDHPVMIDFRFGRGRVPATRTTIEWRYVGDFVSLPQNKKLLAKDTRLAASGPVFPVRQTCPAEPGSGTLQDMQSRLLSQVARILRDRDLAPIAAALFLHGSGQGMTVPIVALWLVRGYHAGPGAIAAYFTCTALGGLVLNPLLGRWSDASGHRRRTAVLTTLLQSLGLLALALHPPFPLVLVAAMGLLSAQVQPPLFALANDHIGAGSAERPRALSMASLRAMISAAWAVGAPLGGVVIGAFGAPWLFGIASALNATALIAVLVWCREAEARRVAVRGSAPGGADAPTRWGQLLLFGLATMLAVAGNTVKMQAVPLYLSRLGLPAAVVGLTYGWMALIEMILMPPVGRLADRMSRRGVVALGTLGGTVFFAAIALVPGSAAVVVAFPAISLLIAALLGVGIGYAQDLDPAHAGLAGGMFFAAQGLGQMIGGPAIAIAQRTWGLPHAFLVPAAEILAGCALILLTRPARDHRAAAPIGPSTQTAAAAD